MSSTPPPPMNVDKLSSIFVMLRDMRKVRPSLGSTKQVAGVAGKVVVNAQTRPLKKRGYRPIIGRRCSSIADKTRWEVPHQREVAYKTCLRSVCTKYDLSLV